MNPEVRSMSPRAEAFEVLDGRYEVRVLEPSPPAVTEGPWFADDPVARGVVPPGRLLVSPVATGDLRWEELAAQDSALAGWCAERWLAAYRPLPPAPDALVETLRALHRLAESVISPARRHATGKIGLRYTAGGFGTPFFGDDVQIRVSGGSLIVQAGDSVRSQRITTLKAAAEHVGAELLPVDASLDDGSLSVDPEASLFLGEWFGFAASVLEELRAEAGERLDPSRVQLWPEHFDLAVELGLERDGARASYGLSPGDGQHPEPYLHVAPWVAPPPHELWQAETFAGAELLYAELLEASDQRAAALEFYRTRLAALTE
jgi:hypothetical protein